MVLCTHGLNSDKFMNKRAMLVVVANVIMLLYNIDCPVAVEG